MRESKKNHSYSEQFGRHRTMWFIFFFYFSGGGGHLSVPGGGGIRCFFGVVCQSDHVNKQINELFQGRGEGGGGRTLS